MPTFTTLTQNYVQRRGLAVEQIATLSGISRKTLYRWVSGEVARPRHWSQVVALATGLHLTPAEADELLHTAKCPTLAELPSLARYEYEFELIDSFHKRVGAGSPRPAAIPPQKRVGVGSPHPGSIPSPQSSADAWPALETPAGAVQPDSRFYIPRLADGQLAGQLTRGGTTTTIQAGRQTGKTSLLMQGIHAARQAGHTCIYVDFQLLDPAGRATLASLLRFISETIAEQLDLDLAETTRYWEGSQNPAQTFNRFLQRSVLPDRPAPLLIAIDEADLLLDAPYKKDFFALLRAWDSRRAFDPAWRQLNLVIVISTHPYLLIDDVNLSPFNIGLTLALQDFTLEQVAELNRVHGAILTPRELPRLMELVGGHPYLVRQALYTLVSENPTFERFLHHAADPDGVFGKHLNFYRHSLQASSPLLEALHNLLARRPAPEETLERLAAVGLIKKDKGQWLPRCGLYAQFFK